MVGICNGEGCLLKCSCQHHTDRIDGLAIGSIDPCFDAVEGHCINYWKSDSVKVILTSSLEDLFSALSVKYGDSF